MTMDAMIAMNVKNTHQINALILATVAALRAHAAVIAAIATPTPALVIASPHTVLTLAPATANHAVAITVITTTIAVGVMTHTATKKTNAHAVKTHAVSASRSSTADSKLFLLLRRNTWTAILPLLMLKIKMRSNT